MNPRLVGGLAALCVAGAALADFPLPLAPVTKHELRVTGIEARYHERAVGKPLFVTILGVTPSGERKSMAISVSGDDPAPSTVKWLDTCVSLAREARSSRDLRFYLIYEGGGDGTISEPGGTVRKARVEACGIE